jgi:hypothetical protein
MSKYDALQRYLESLDVDHWAATFDEIETILRFPLPDSAYSYPAWWANQDGNGHSHCKAWQNAGWRTGELDLKGHKVTFHRSQKPSSITRQNSSNIGLAMHSRSESENVSKHEVVRGIAAGQKPFPLTMADAKAGLAIHFGVPPESIEITIKG